MSSNPRVMQLLEEILESSRTPEEVCAEDPELLPEVRERLRQCFNVDAEFDAMFPATRGTSIGQRLRHMDRAAELPDIPGFEVESVLGRGGMGVVYKARQIKLNRPIAIKMILAGAYASELELTRFMHEAQAVASLRHAHIVQVHDVGEVDGLPYFTMEYVEGGNLGQNLAGTPQAARPTAQMLTTLANAMEAAHAAGIVHRDLKPGNILLTDDGTPKITDFGLARHFGDDQGLTRSGAKVGTPSYMAPEQAAGKASAVGPAADVYSLGAVLYEMLTGRPPFRGETASETERQVIIQEPVAPSRLNARVPRDLENICLMCLRKEPERRYTSAAALADDLTRFLEGHPIHARPPSWGGRLVRWCRREPAAAGLVAAVLALGALTLAGGWWLERQRAQGHAATAREEGRTWQAAEAALQQASSLQDEGRWPEVRAALNGAPNLSDTSAPVALRERLRKARADADIVTELEDIRMRPAAAGSAWVDHLYSDAFRKYGISIETLETQEAAARIRGSAIRPTLLGFLHDWVYWVSDLNRKKLLAVVDAADDDPWRKALRAAQATRDVEKLKVLGTAPEARAQPPVVLSGLTNVLLTVDFKDEARALLHDAHERHPQDFWINYQLGQFLLDHGHPQEAVGYFRAAVAIRSNSDKAYEMLGKALRGTADTDGALAAFQKALSLKPGRSGAKDLVPLLAPMGRLEEARAAWERELEHNPPEDDRWYGYPQLCLFLGREDAYLRIRKVMLQRAWENPRDWTIGERTSLASLLRPATGDQLQRIAAVIDLTVGLGPKSPHPDNAYIKFVQGLLAFRQGRFDQAISLLDEAALKLPNRPGPGLVLAMAQFQTGSTTKARKTLATAVRNFPWKESQAQSTSMWVSHVLRREGESMILPSLPAFLRGEYQPTDNDERLALLGICHSKGLHAAAARLYTDAFAADATLPETSITDCIARASQTQEPAQQINVLNTDCLYLAACDAAMAGGQPGKDGINLSDAERMHWRNQAREWLLADLSAWTGKQDGSPTAAPDLTKKMLALWQIEPDLERLRDPQALRNLPNDEEEKWTALWQEVRLRLRESL